MLAELIHHIELGIVFYVKQVEGIHYHGDNTYSAEYSEKSDYLSSTRKNNIEDILQLCHHAVLRQNTARELAHTIIDYLQQLSNPLSQWFGKMPRLQLAILHAIAAYHPGFIQWQGKIATLNQHAPSFKPTENNTPDTIVYNRQQQLLQQNELLLQLQAANQALQQQLNKQQTLVENLADELEHAKLEIIELRQQRNKGAERIGAEKSLTISAPLLNEHNQRYEPT